MKYNLKKEFWLNTYFFAFIVCLTYKFVSVLFDDSKKEYWGITEWMINYQGGFVRRGLRGEIVYHLNQLYNFDVYTVITIITTVAFVSLIIFFIRGFIKKGFPLFILPFVIFLGNPILNNFWMRADSIILLLFILVVTIAIKKPRLYLFWINILSVLGLLIHELFIFISVPFLILFLVQDVFRKNEKLNLFKSLIISGAVLLPTFIGSFLVTYFKGTSGTAFLIWNSWKGISFPESAITEMEKLNMGAIAGIGLSIKGGLKIPAEFVRCFDSGLYGPLVFTLSIYCIYLVVSNIHSLRIKTLGCTPHISVSQKALWRVIFFQFCCTAPLYVIGDDFSRWIYFWIASSFILLILIPDERILSIFPKKIDVFTKKIDLIFCSITGKSQTMLILITLGLGFPLYSWNLDGSIETSSIYVVLSSISSVVEKLMSAVL